MSTTRVSSAWIDEDLRDVSSLLNDVVVKEAAPLGEKFRAQGQILDHRQGSRRR
ncbi:hypothetical protein ACT3TS_13930 [Specibacter sp. AOP5-B1-6]|uniref:hypothetical protein n=1 Tax=Specibacter sp. AOP5-B1-6 TaxID=3457653 RepID=UPI003FB78303